MVDLSLVQQEHLWYIIGLIVTDGNLSIDGRHIVITSKDRELLRKVRSALFINHLRIGKKARSFEEEKKYSVLQIGDVNFYRLLLNIGLSPRKSLTMGKIQVPENYFGDFLRGIIDGDGSINTWRHRTNKHMQWCLRIMSAAPVFAQWLKNKVEQHFLVRGKIYQSLRERRNPIFTIKFGKLAAKVILKKIYYRNCLTLNRKFVKAAACLQSTNGLSKYGSVVL